VKYFFLYGPPVWFHQVSGIVPEVLVVTNTASYKLQYMYVCYHTKFHIQVHKCLKYYYENEKFASSM